MGTFPQYVTMILMFLTAVFLIVLILVQRGRGGGLTGARHVPARYFSC